MRKVNKLSLVFLISFVIAGIILFSSFQKFLPFINQAIYFCQSILKNSIMISAANYFAITSLIIFFTALLWGVIKFLYLNTKDYFMSLRLKRSAAVDRNIHAIVSNLGLSKDAILVRSNRKFAFCLGLRSSKIYFSTGLCASLSTKELEAVLLHEKYHLNNHDSSVIALVSAVKSFFPLFPLVGDLFKRYKTSIEIKADRFAVDKGRKSGLLSALKKFLKFAELPASTAVAIADQDSIEPRICSLVGKPYGMKRIGILNIIVTVFSSLVIVAIVVMPAYSNENDYDRHDMICEFNFKKNMSSAANQFSSN